LNILNPIRKNGFPAKVITTRKEVQTTDDTYVKGQATLRGSKTRMKSTAAKHTSSYISKILGIIVEE